MRQKFNPELITKVPGFVMESGRVDIPVAGGIMIPVLSLDQKIQGFQIRSSSRGGAKYFWFSSGINSVGSPVHQLTTRGGNPATASITEGPIKAEVLNRFSSNQYTLGVAGVNNVKHVYPFCRKNEIEKVDLYFDSDWRSNEGVKNSLISLAESLDNRGICVRIVVWDSEWKGIDDYLLGGGTGATAVNWEEVKNGTVNT